MRKTIYVPSQEVWDEVEAKAKAMGLKVSPYLLGGYHLPNESQMDRIERKIDSLTPKTRDTPIIDPMAGMTTMEKAIDYLQDEVPKDLVQNKRTRNSLFGVLPDEPPIPMATEGLSDGYKDRLEDDMDMLKRKQAEIDSIKAKKIAKVKGKVRPDDEVKGEIMNQLGQVRSGPIMKKGKK